MTTLPPTPLTLPATSDLMRLAQNRGLTLTIPGGDLEPVEENARALDLLAQWRGVTFTDGGGIGPPTSERCLSGTRTQ